MIPFWKTFKRFWYIPFLAVGGIAAFVLFRKSGMNLPLANVRRHLEAIQAGAAADNIRIEQGTEAAVAQVEAKYDAELKALDADKRAKAEKLKHDPEALTKFLVLG